MSGAWLLLLSTGKSRENTSWQKSIEWNSKSKPPSSSNRKSKTSNSLVSVLSTAEESALLATNSYPSTSTPFHTFSSHWKSSITLKSKNFSDSKQTKKHSTFSIFKWEKPSNSLNFPLIWAISTSDGCSAFKDNTLSTWTTLRTSSHNTSWVFSIKWKNSKSNSPKESRKKKSAKIISTYTLILSKSSKMATSWKINAKSKI